MTGYVALRGDRISRVYGTRRTAFTAVKPVDFEVNSESAIGIVGESGSGKSTLTRMLVGLERVTTGSVTYNAAPITRFIQTHAGRLDFRRAVQFVGQDTSSSFDPRRTLRDSVATPLKVLLGSTGSEAEDRIVEVLRLLQLDPAQLRRYPGEVSGGQRQRFALARALVVRPRILLCDEVVSALDVSVQGAVLNVIKEYRETNQVGLAFVSHGLPATSFLARELVVMCRGEIVERGETAQVLHEPRHPYTAKLLGASLRRRRVAAR
ncbi:MAG TPA: ATP-binding cassette domain-containing protein [Pseudonocardia sp.]|jgi:ABC-type dipeptide/oligopeptide/nickel transport system ATPase subunit|uniref:ABC transporter ATP-binding protein n=1 Tax=Pseudonocardia sp. TaxID=60912 RepID=UPI002C628B1D|nr:ATP-binding cassette domain-containing protein [Pseudonocardia sp.]HTF48181.1 ATP-binding cassette domain-containing protein [Pseudonocardia sp.]